MGQTNPPPPSPAGKSAEKKPAAKVSIPELSALPAMTVDSLVISNASLQFADRSFTPEVNLALEKVSGTLGRISTESRDAADVELHASVDTGGPGEVKGRIN